MHLLLHLLLLLPASTVAVSSVRATVPEEKVTPAEEDAFIARLGIGKEDFTPMRRAPEVCFRTHLLYVFVRISYMSSYASLILVWLIRYHEGLRQVLWGGDCLQYAVNLQVL